MNEDLRETLEQPLTLAYLSSITLSMLHRSTKDAKNPEEYITEILDDSKAMMDAVIKEQLESYDMQLEILRKSNDTLTESEFEEVLKSANIPTLDEFKVEVESIVNKHFDNFEEYKVDILKEIEDGNK